LFVCRCYLRKQNSFIHSFIPPYKFGFVGDRKCVAAKEKKKTKANHALDLNHRGNKTRKIRRKMTKSTRSFLLEESYS
jgi:hypothetical protein